MNKTIWTHMKQLELEMFFPLREQIPLNLSFDGCDTKNKIVITDCINYTWATVATNIAPQLKITPSNSVGEFSIGGIHVGLEKKPSWLQRKLHKVLGFDWKDKN